MALCTMLACTNACGDVLGMSSSSGSQTYGADCRTLCLANASAASLPATPERCNARVRNARAQRQS